MAYTMVFCMFQVVSHLPMHNLIPRPSCRGDAFGFWKFKLLPVMVAEQQSCQLLPSFLNTDVTDCSLSDLFELAL